MLMFVQSDPEKESHMPKDGIVHELTSNVSIRNLFQRVGRVVHIKGTRVL